MANFVSLVVAPMLIVFTAHRVCSRDLRGEPRDGTGILLSALCIREGQLRKACLQDVSSISLRNVVDRILEDIQDDDRYGSDILMQLDKSLDGPGDSLDPDDDDLLPHKRSRSRSSSGFYSNWK